MKLSITLILMSAALVFGGAADLPLGELGISKGRALFFLFAEAVLSRFTVGVGYYIDISAACVLFAICFGAVALRSEKSALSALGALLLCASFGIPAFIISKSGSEPGLYSAALFLGFTAILLGLRRGAAASALAPIAASLAAGAVSSAETGLFELDVTEACLIMQNSALMLSFALTGLSRYAGRIKNRSFQKR